MPRNDEWPPPQVDIENDVWVLEILERPTGNPLYRFEGTLTRNGALRSRFSGKSEKIVLDEAKATKANTLLEEAAQKNKKRIII